MSMCDTVPYLIQRNSFDRSLHVFLIVIFIIWRSRHIFSTSDFQMDIPGTANIVNSLKVILVLLGNQHTCIPPLLSLQPPAT